MLFVVDIGNSNIVLGVMRDAEHMIFAGRIRTVKDSTTAQLIKSFNEAIRENRVSLKNITGAIIASVVPEITNEAKEAVEAITGCEPMILKAGLEVGFKVCTDNPSQVGADLIAAAVGGASKYKGALAIFDLGTANTLSVLSSDKRYLGTIIMPGVYISLNAMIRRASQLPRFNLEPPKHLIGKNTIESMCSGVMYGNAAMIDGLIDRVQEELGEKVTVLITGGLGSVIRPYCKHKLIPERDLIPKGLWHIYQMNKDKMKKTRN